MALEIIKTLPGDSNFHWFEYLPKLLYPNHSIRFKQSDSLNLEFLKNCFVLLRMELLKQDSLYITTQILLIKIKMPGVWEIMSRVDDQKVSKALFDKVFAEAKSLNANISLAR